MTAWVTNRESGDSDMPDPAIISKVASLLVSGLYVGLAFWGVFPRNAIAVIPTAMLLGLPLIWFPNFSAAVRGFIGRASAHAEEPSSMIVFTGWVILVVLPVVVAMLCSQTPAVHVLPH
jgi:hypothetical protein